MGNSFENTRKMSQSKGKYDRNLTVSKIQFLTDGSWAKNELQLCFVGLLL